MPRSKLVNVSRMPDTSSLSARLKRARHAAGLTQAELAKATGVNQKTISAIEVGRQTTTTEVLSLSRALAVNAEWLATGAGPEQLVEHDDARAIVEQVLKLPLERRAIALRMLKALEEEQPSDTDASGSS